MRRNYSQYPAYSALAMLSLFVYQLGPLEVQNAENVQHPLDRGRIGADSISMYWEPGFFVRDVHEEILWQLAREVLTVN